MNRCPCGGHSYVLNVRDGEADVTLRSRECRRCHRRWSTVELAYTQPALTKALAACGAKRVTYKRDPP